MENNVGAMDSWIRIFAGVWITYAAMVGYIGNMGFLALILLVTGLMRFCPFYYVLKINTNRCETKTHH